MIKEGFVLRKTAGVNMVTPTGLNIKEFNGFLVLNDTGAYIFSKLKNGETVLKIAQSLVQEYDVSLEKAEEDVIAVIASLREAGIVCEN